MTRQSIPTNNQPDTAVGKAGYKLAAEHDFLPRQQFLIFEVEGAR